MSRLPMSRGSFANAQKLKTREQAKRVWFSYANSSSRKVPMAARCAASSDGLQFLAGLEAHSLARRNIDFLNGAGLTPDAGFERLDVDDADAPQFDAVAAPERIR